MTQQCPICTAAECNATTPCQHEFCEECIVKWGKTCAMCPLCKAEFKTYRIIGGDEEKELPPPSPRKEGEMESDVNLDCLDWPFFLGEVERLSQQVANAKRQILTQRSKNQDNSDKLEALEYVSVAADDCRARFERGDRFNPEALLSELHELQKLINDVVAGRVPEMFQSQPARQISGGGGGEEWHDDDARYDDDDDDEGYYYDEDRYGSKRTSSGGGGSSNNHNNGGWNVTVVRGGGRGGGRGRGKRR